MLLPFSWLTLFVILLLTEQAWNRWVQTHDLMEERNVEKHRKALDVLGEKEFPLEKAMNLHSRVTEFSASHNLPYNLVKNIVLLLGGYGVLEAAAKFVSPGSGPIVTLVIMSSIFTVLEKPWELLVGLRLHKISTEFDLTHQSIKEWWKDQGKTMALEIPLGLLFSAIIVGIIEYGGKWWWVWLPMIFGALVVPLTVAQVYIFSRLLNKQYRMPPSEFRDELMKIVSVAGFREKHLWIQEESKNSKQENASVLCKFGLKRIVVYDNMLKTKDRTQVMAVFAHEVGHALYKERWWEWPVHVGKIVLSVAMVYFFKNTPEASLAFGFKSHTSYSTIVLFELFWHFPNTVFSYATNWLDQEEEFLADAYAKKVTGDAELLIRSLSSMGNVALSLPHSWPFGSMISESHPSTVARTVALREGTYSAMLEKRMRKPKG